LAYVPTVVENEGGNRERTFDIYSRLLKDRIIIIGRPIDDVVANLAVAQLMYLAADDPEKEIQIYVNSPGGAVTAGLAIYDTMQYVQAPISTVCIGRAASFGTVVLMAGAKGKRFSLPNATIHLHQPLIGEAPKRFRDGKSRNAELGTQRRLIDERARLELVADDGVADDILHALNHSAAPLPVQRRQK